MLDAALDNKQLAVYMEAIQAGLKMRGLDPALVATVIEVLTALLLTMFELENSSGHKDTVLSTVSNIESKIDPATDSKDADLYLTALTKALAARGMDEDQSDKLASDIDKGEITVVDAKGEISVVDAKAP